MKDTQEKTRQLDDFLHTLLPDIEEWVLVWGERVSEDLTATSIVSPAGTSMWTEAGLLEVARAIKQSETARGIAHE